MRLYVLKNGEPEPEPDVGVWAAWMEQANEERVVEHTAICTTPNLVRVSTVFLGMDHAFDDGPPVLWETMVFGGVLEGEQRRYTSRAAAVTGHAALVAEVKAAETTASRLLEGCNSE